VIAQDKVVTVFGISGVGKTRLIRNFIEGRENFRHVSAGSLLRRAVSLGSDVGLEALRTADMSDIIRNQHLLAREFVLDKTAHPGSTILFDGHSIIYNDHVLVPVPDDVIAAIGPWRMIFVSASPERVLEHRANDASRVRPERTLDELDQEQSAALAACERFRDVLQVPLITLQSGDDHGFKSAILDGFTT
jgi:adenylate kinase